MIQIRVKAYDPGDGRWIVKPPRERGGWRTLKPGEPYIIGNGWGSQVEFEVRKNRKRDRKLKEKS